MCVIFLYRQKEEEEKRNKMAALAAVRVAKTAMTVNVPEEVKDKKLLSITPKTGSPMRNDTALKVSNDM